MNTLNHIAIILDGNRRWAVENGLPKLVGHTEGAKTLRTIAETVAQKKIPYLTVWAMSTENLKNRSKKEVAHLFTLFGKLTDYLPDFFEHNIRLKLIGDIENIPKKTQEKLASVVEKTKNHTGMTLTLAINYGGRDDIVRAVKKALIEKRNPDTFSEETFSSLLDTDGIPDPDMVIRTGGDIRLSGFLAWQCTYAELYFTNTFWPAFTKEELDKAIDWFETRKRRFGGDGG